MIYIKSILVGAALAAVTLIAYVVIASVSMSRKHLGVEVGLDLKAFMSTGLFWVLVLIPFLLGFYVVLRTAKR